MLPNDNALGDAESEPPEAPVPESATLSEVEPAVMLQAALSEDVVEGVKLMAAVQLADGARLAPQFVEATAKSPELVPLIVPVLSVTVLEEEFVTVMFWEALVVPFVTVPKDRLVGVTLVVPPVPIPESATCWGLLPSESVKVRFAVRVPAAVGLNCTVTVQLDDAARVEPQVFLEMMKSPGLVPVKAMLLIFRVLLPALVSVADFAPPVLPTATFHQEMELGEAVTCAEASGAIAKNAISRIG